jgi:hypothetical protein
MFGKHSLEQGKPDYAMKEGWPTKMEISKWAKTLPTRICYSYNERTDLLFNISVAFVKLKTSTA